MPQKQNKLEIIRHSTSHILAYAVKELFGDKIKFAIGPTIEDGFYYDFDLGDKTFSADDLPKIEKKMAELIKKNLKFEKTELKIEDALKKMKGQSYKIELIKEFQKAGDPGDKHGARKKVSFYTVGDFEDLCRGPHVASTKKLGDFKLMKIAGAYWRGDEKNKMLQRIYGTAYETKQELTDYLKLLEEAKKRDHRVIGKDLDLFVFSELVGKGLPLFTEKGSIIRRELERFIVDEEIKRGYQHVYTPDLAKVDLYKKSGHYPYYKDSMYPVMKIDDEELILRPMTCPHHFELYLSRPRTYKELPLKIAELAKQFRYEKSGELSGLMRVRSFCLADSHIVCRLDQAKEQINEALDLIEYVASVMGIKKGENFRYRLSLGDRKEEKKYYKDDKAWDNAENILREVLKKRRAPFFESEGEAAFYGPKIDIQIKNFAGKEDTAFTVQYDFVMPKRFELNYIDEKGKKQEAVVIHRSSIGAIERVMAFLIEYYAGAFPTWLSPVQVVIIPVSEKFNDWGEKVLSKLKSTGIRAELDDSDESLGKRIRNAEKQKTPYILVVGEKETVSKSVAVRKRGEGDLGARKLEKFVEEIKKEIQEKK
ncbi:MAG: threonine--tRNA ligase [Patescibacteria group bacterium]